HGDRTTVLSHSPLPCDCPKQYLHSVPTRRSSDLKNPANIPSSEILPIHFHIGIFKYSPITFPFLIIFKIGYLYNFISLYKNLRRSEEHTSELQSRFDLVCRLLLEKNNPHTKEHRT